MIRGDAFLARSHHVALVRPLRHFVLCLSQQLWGFYRGNAVVFEESTWGEPAKFSMWSPSYFKTYQAVRRPGWGQHDHVTNWNHQKKRATAEVTEIATVESTRTLVSRPALTDLHFQRAGFSTSSAASRTRTTASARAASRFATPAAPCPQLR